MSSTDAIPVDQQLYAERLADASSRVGVQLAEPAPVQLPGFRFVSEREAGPWICCAPCSGAMVAAWAIGTPATLAEAHAIRTAAGVPHTGGLTPGELAAGVERWTGLELSPVASSSSAIAARLAAGHAIALPLTYGRLPTYLRRWSPLFTGGHMSVLAGTGPGGTWGWFDTCAPAGWGGEYVEPAVIMAAAWDSGAASAGRSSSTEVDSMVILERPQLADVGVGDGFYEAPGGARLGAFGGPATVHVLGVPMDGSEDHLNLGWRIVRVTSSAIDGKPADKLVYMLTGELANLRPIPAPPAPAPSDPDAILAARRLEYDRVASALTSWTAGAMPERP